MLGEGMGNPDLIKMYNATGLGSIGMSVGSLSDLQKQNSLQSLMMKSVQNVLQSYFKQWRVPYSLLQYNSTVFFNCIIM